MVKSLPERISGKAGSYEPHRLGDELPEDGVSGLNHRPWWPDGYRQVAGRRPNRRSARATRVEAVAAVIAASGYVASTCSRRQCGGICRLPNIRLSSPGIIGKTARPRRVADDRRPTVLSQFTKPDYRPRTLFTGQWLSRRQLTQQEGLLDLPPDAADDSCRWSAVSVW